MEPREVARDIAHFIGDKGVVCGGCVRDIVMGNKPKDYDVFIFTGWQLSDITNNWEEFFDSKPIHSDQSQRNDYGSEEVTIYTTSYKGHIVQLIHGNTIGIDRYPKSTGSRTTGDYKLNCIGVINSFPFTINKMWYNFESDEISIVDDAKEALDTKQMIFAGKDHRAGWDDPETIRLFLVTRIVYLAKKLNFTIPSMSIRGIYERYGTHSSQLKDLL